MCCEPTIESEHTPRSDNKRVHSKEVYAVSVINFFQFQFQVKRREDKWEDLRTSSKRTRSPRPFHRQ